MAVQQAQQAYSVTEVAKILGLSRPTVYQALRRNELPSFRVGGKVLVPRAAVERMLAGGNTATRTPASN